MNDLPTQRLKMAQKFLAKVDKHGPIPTRFPELGNCWIWTSNVSTRGVGRLMYNGKRFWYAHQIAWLLHYGDLPPFVMHKCDNSICVRWDHLFAGEKGEQVMEYNGGDFHKAKTKCPYGHPYTPENTVISYKIFKRKSGPKRLQFRVCKKCRSEWSRVSKDKTYFGVGRHYRTNLLRLQSGKCANPLCPSTDSGVVGKRWALDHDHATGMARGLLCHRCNLVLGHVGDDPKILQGLQIYLRQWSNREPSDEKEAP